VHDVAILRAQARYAVLAALRNPRVVVFGMAFPVILLVLFSTIFTSGGSATVSFSGGRLDAKAYFTGGLIAYAIALQGFTQLAISVTTQREGGQLKRLRGTPMPAWTFIAAQVVRVLVLVTAMVAALLALAVIAFGVSIPAEGVLAIVVYVVLGTATMVTLGLAVTAVFDTADSASSAAPFVAVMLSFISGVFIPVDTLPNWLESVGRIFPLYHLAEGLQLALLPGGGSGLTGANVAVLAAWTLGALVFGVRRFRWEPQTARG